MTFEYYVMNYDHNKKIVEPFNIFRNYIVNGETEKAIKKYLRSPSKFHFHSFTKGDFYGFEGLKEVIATVIRGEESFRCEYEMGVCYKFEQDISNVRHMDCWMQCEPNMEMITHECIRQYKAFKKENKK